jgi:hypothetical protein
MAKIGPALGLHDVKTALFLDETALAENSLLSDVTIPERGLAIFPFTSQQLIQQFNDSHPKSG